MNILLVEDDDGMCHLLRRLLRDSDGEVDRVDSWEEMVRINSDKHFHVILLDLGLIDSLPNETLKRIKPFKMQHPDSAICVVTGHSHITAQQAIEAGADEFIHKSALTEKLRLVTTVQSLFHKFSNRGKALDTAVHLHDKAVRETIEQMKES